MKDTNSQAWPPGMLEAVPCCPACSSTTRQLLYSQLTDRVFNVAPGQWSLYHCENCKSAYLDPRPTESSIHLAYRSYYTHECSNKEQTPQPASGLRKLLANSYLNQQYGTDHQPSIYLGFLLVRLLPVQRERLDARHRWLNIPAPGARLLDIGFGNADFLRSASDAGWTVTGIDPDPIAVKNAREQRLDVALGTIETLETQENTYDAITLNQVIEHVHHPDKVLQRAYKLLKPGGCLYLSTPNIESAGARQFSNNWLHLDPPRHLLVFSEEALKNMLLASGFNELTFISRYNVAVNSYIASSNLSASLAAFHPRDIMSRLKGILFSFQSRRNKSRMEYISILAKKEV